VNVITGMLDRLIGGLWRVSRASVLLCGVLLFALCAMVGAEVLMRRFLGLSFQGVDELAGYTLATVATFAFTYTLLERAHIRIDVVYARLGPVPRAFLDLLALAALIAFFGTVLYFAAELFLRNWALGATSMTPLAVPLVIPQSVFVVALALFVLTASILFLRAALALVSGDVASVQALAGSKSSAVEAEDEIALARQLHQGGRAR